MKTEFGSVVYFEDPLQDEFSGVGERPDVPVDSSFRYVNRNIFYRIGKFLVYNVFVRTYAYLFCKFKFGMKTVGREKLKPYAKSGYFLYGNHTQIPADGFIPNVLTFPKTIYVIVNPDNIALKGTRTLMMMLGALPTPTSLGGYKNFSRTVDDYIQSGHPVVIYPEAHIWPYCTRIRPFTDVSFSYPAKNGAPVFAFTVTYRKSKRGKPRIVTYVDGPFFSSEEKPRNRQKDLRQQVYNAMVSRAHSDENYAFITYLPKNPPASGKTDCPGGEASPASTEQGKPNSSHAKQSDGTDPTEIAEERTERED